MKKMRVLYDKLYVSIDSMYTAHQKSRDAKKKARTSDPKENFERDYREKVIPYWKQFKAPRPKKYWYKTYGPSTEPVDPRYVPYDIYIFHILPHFNALAFAIPMQDKCLHKIFVPDMHRPETVVKNIAGVFYDDQIEHISQEEAVRRCLQADSRLIVKPSIGSGGGDSIRFYDSADCSEADILEMFRSYGQNYIVQKKMEQHAILASLNPNSINTIRIITLLFKEEVHVLCAIVRVGGPSNEVDNVSQGGYQCTILPNGHLDGYAITKKDGKWVNTEQTHTGVYFRDIAVPSYDRVVEAVKRSAMKMAHFKYIGWDIAVDPDGTPTLIEYNVVPSQSQGTCGPCFGDLTEAVLEEVFGRR